MPCELVPFPNDYAVVCARLGRSRKCFYCSNPSGWLCDYQKGSRSCDRALCGDHRVNQGPEVDWCLAHVPAGQGRLM